MKKFVIQTVQMIKRTYYVEVDDPTWAHDAITMEEIMQFSDKYLSEDIINTTEVENFPMAEDGDCVNAAVVTFDEDSGEWIHEARWDLVE